MNEFEMDYRLSVDAEAEYIYHDTKETAENIDFEPDIFFLKTLSKE